MSSLYKRRIAVGLCGSCGKRPLILGKPQCAVCKELSRSRSATRREVATAAGLCLSNCGRPRLPNRARCDKCAKKQAADMRQREARWIASGLCRGCGKRPPKENCVLCQKCINDRSATSMRHYARRKAAGLCYYCNNPPVSGMHSCQRHLDISKEYNFQIKVATFNAYGGMVCVGTDCGEVDPDVLELDHVNRDGAEERERLGIDGGSLMFSPLQWLYNCDTEAFRYLNHHTGFVVVTGCDTA